ncbi:MAG TPA: TonB-dependent receptor [Vicinamibacterales bacterium]
MTAVLRPHSRTILLVLTFSFFLFPSSFSTSSAAFAAGLSGRVVDPDGRAVANAEVIISGATATPLRARTGADGKFDLASLAAGRYTVIASAAGLVSDAIAINVTTATTLEIALHLSAVNETMVVSAAQIDQPLSRTPDSVTVIDGREIDAKQQFTLSAALRSVPGLTLQQNGGPGTVTSLFTRGGESDYTLVLVDGVRANAFGGGLDLSQVPLQDVDRIEVLRGSQSSLYGSDAIGGVIQVVTRSGGRPSAQAQVETGSRDMRRVAAATTGELKNGFRWQAGANHFEDDGFTGQAANGQTVSNDDGNQSQASGSLGWRQAERGTDLQASIQYLDSERGSPGPYGSDPAQRYSGVDTVSRGTTTRVGGGARLMQPWFGAASRVRQRIEYDSADFDLTFKSPFGTSEGNTHRDHVRVQTDVSANASFGFSGGVEWLGESGSSTYITAGTAGEVPVERGVLGIFGEGRWNATDRATLTAGLRGERITRDALPGDPLAFQPRPDFPEETVNSVNPKLSASFALSSGTRLRGAFGTGIRPPDAFEIAFTDNSGLKPERSKSGEFGATQTAAGGAVQLDGTFFYNSYTDLIISVGRTFSGSSRYRTDNISNARAQGAEFSAAWRLNAVFDIRGNYTFLASEILAVNGSSSAQTPYAVGDPLLRRPRHSGSVDASWTRNRASAFAQVQLRGETLDAEPAFGPTGGLYTNDGYTVINLGGSYRPVKGVEIMARMLNLFDRSYEEVLGYPAPRRTAYVGARFVVGR